MESDSTEAGAGFAADPIVWGLKRSIWIQIGIITLLFCGLFWPNLRRLWDKTNPFYGEANWGHAVCIPVIGLYYLYVNREKLLQAESPRKSGRRVMGLRVWALLSTALVLPLGLVREEARHAFRPALFAVAAIVVVLLAVCLWSGSESLVERVDDHSAGWFGGFVMVFGIAVFQYAIYPGQNDFIKDFGMVITLFGVVLALAGWNVMKTAWFPIAFLVCGLPWPGLVYSRVAGPLQQLAANAAVWTLQVTGVEATVGGTKISMIGGNGQWRTLNVAEACAGMRSLMTFISVAAAVAFLSSRPLWEKFIIVFFAVPIAIFCNVMRVSGQGLLDRYVSHSLSENFAHQFVGLIMLIPAFLLILLVGWILDQIFLEQVDRRFVAMAPKVISRTAVQPPMAIAAPPLQRNLSASRPPAEKPAAKPAIATKPLAAARPAAAAKSASPAPSAMPARPSASPIRPSSNPLKPAGSGNKTVVPPPPTVRLASRPPSQRRAPGGSGGFIPPPPKGGK